MLKYLRVIIKVLPSLIGAYFSWMIKYSKHPEKYDINLRFNRVQKLVRKVLIAFKVNVQYFNFDEFYQKADKNRPYLIVANHISDFDPLIFIAIAKKPLTVVGKVEISKYPFVNRIIKCLDGEFLDRNDLKQSLKVFKNIASKMEKIDNLDRLIFPEGTRNKININEVQAFHYGTFKPAMKTNSDIHVMSLLGTQRVLDVKCKNKMYPVLVKYNGTFSSEDYAKLTTVVVSEQAQKLCNEGVKSLIEEERSLNIKLNKN